MERPKTLRVEFPSVLDRAYAQYQKYRTVKDIMSTDVSTIGPDASMSEAATAMGEKHIGSLVVVAEGKPIGIVTERDLLSKVVARDKDPKAVKVRDVMSSPLVTISPAATIKEAAQTMIKQKGRLVALRGEKVTGIITASDLIKSLPEAPETLMSVDDVMTKKVETADEATTVVEIAKTMGEKRIGSVVITRKGEPIGIFTERDLMTNFLAKRRSLKTKVGTVASSPIISAASGITVHQAAYIMANKHIRRLPIIKEDKIIGIVTARDLVEAYAK